MENLENSPLLRLFNRKQNHSANSKINSCSKLSLRKNEAQKAKLNDVLSVCDSEVQKNNAEDKKFQSTVGYLKSKNFPPKKQLSKFVHTKRSVLEDNTVESTAGKSDVTCFSKSNERQLLHRTFTGKNMNFKCSENNYKYFDSWKAASLSKASQEFILLKTELQSTDTESNSSELLSCNISSVDPLPSEVSPRKGKDYGNEFSKKNSEFLDGSEKPSISKDLNLCLPSNVSNPVSLKDGSPDVINLLNDHEIDKNNSICILSSSSESLSGLEKVRLEKKELVAFDLICSNFPNGKYKDKYDQEPKYMNFFEGEGKQNYSFDSSSETTKFTPEEFSLNMLEGNEKSPVATSNFKIKSSDEICEQINKLNINAEASCASTVYSQEQFPFKYATGKKYSAENVISTKIPDQNKEKQPAKSTIFTSNNFKKMQLLEDLLSSDDEDNSPLPLSQRITANVSISENKNSTCLSKRHLNALSSSSEEFEEFLQKLKTPVVSKTKSLSHNNPKNMVVEVKTGLPTRKILTTLSDVVKSKITNKSLGASPALPIKTLPMTNFPNERRKITFSSDEEDYTFDEVFTPTVEPTAMKQDDTKKNRKSPIKYSFLASLSAIVPESKANPEALVYRKNFGSKKDELVKKLFTLYNSQIFNNKLPLDMKITWNSRMRKTAGFCYYRRDTSCPLGRSTRIELAPKILDLPDRLRDTLAHELCHAAAWLIHGYRDGHGTIWKYWACRVKQVFPELPAVTRCHSYDIVTKYVYKCTGCGGRIGRHSKSIDITKKVCGKCRSSFELFVNGKHSSSSSTPKGFALFVKENYGKVKKNHNNAKHAEVMKILSKEFSSKAKVS